VPGTVAAEVGYLLARDGGPAAQTQFLESLADGTFSPVDLRPADYRRAGELVTAYRDLGLGTTDATVIALCERLELTEVATIDRRRFTIVRPGHVDVLVLLPE
jgi:predicted nucleic acid-binding protein